MLNQDTAPSTQPPPPADPALVLIQPTRGWQALDLREVWAYRDLLGVLCEREVKLRYKQTALGILWVVLQPLIAALIFAVIFGRLARIPTGDLPYILMAFCGMVGWLYFAGALQRASRSLVASPHLISKVYFPRITIPLAHILAVLVDLVVMLLVLALLLLVYQHPLTWAVLTAPLFIGLMVLTATGGALWLSALSVQYRDFVHVLPTIIQVGMYASPVVYPISLIPEPWRLLYSLNPAVGFVGGLRWSLLGESVLTPGMVLVSTAVALVVFVSGLLFFRRVERGFADVI